MKESGQGKERESTFELLRIIAMLCIIFGHFVGKGGIVVSPQSTIQLSSLFFWAGGKLGVNIFVLITGFFGGGQRRCQSKKIVTLWMTVICYSWISFLGFVVVAPETINRDLVISTAFPIARNVWWFVTTYIGLCILQPMINLILEKLDKKNHQKLLITGGIMLSVIPTVIFNALPWFSNLAWFIYLYCCGLYIRRYPPRISKKICVGVFCIAWIGMWMMDILLQVYTSIEKNYFSYMYRIPLFLASVAVFLVFTNLHIRQSKFINKMGKATLGVYLIHDSLFCRSFLWITVLHADRYYNTWFYLIHMTVSCVLIFIVCVIVDLCRERLFEVIEKKLHLQSKLSVALEKIIRIDFLEDDKYEKG